MIGIIASLTLCAAAIVVTFRSWRTPGLLAKRLLFLLSLLPLPTLLNLKDAIQFEEPKVLLTLPAYVIALVMALRALADRAILIAVLRVPGATGLCLAFTGAAVIGVTRSDDLQWSIYALSLILPANLAFFLFGLVTSEEDLARGRAFALTVAVAGTVFVALMAFYWSIGRVQDLGEARGEGMVFSGNQVIPLLTLYAPLWLFEAGSNRRFRITGLFGIGAVLLLTGSRSMLFPLVLYGWLGLKSRRLRVAVLAGLAVSVALVLVVRPAETAVDAANVVYRIGALPEAFELRYGFFGPYVREILSRPSIFGVGPGQTEAHPVEDIRFSTLHLLFLSVSYELGVVAAMTLATMMVLAILRGLFVAPHGSRRTLAISLAWFMVLAHASGAEWFVVIRDQFPAVHMGATLSLLAGFLWSRAREGRATDAA